MLKHFSIILATLFILSSSVLAQDVATSTKAITLEDIWQNYTFTPRYISGFNFQNDGRHYTRLERNAIRQYDLTTGKATKVIFDAAEIEENEAFPSRFSAYSFSDDESKIMIETERESIYRHSSKANFFIWDGKSLSQLFDKGKQMYASFNSQADKVAFVHKNNLYFKDLKSGRIVQITHDGKYNHIINGALDWVYEEEFSFDRGFDWSPDGQKIAFYRFNESHVKEFNMNRYNGDLYPEQVTFKYPKVGERNSIVSIHIYDLKTGKTVKVDIGSEEDQYIPRIKWTQNANQLCVFRMNRHQNQLELLLADAKTGATSLLLKETNKYYIDIHDNLTFLKDGKHFIWTSEMDAWNHIYLYDMNGKLKQQITKGEWEVTNFYGIDEKNGLIYYQAAEESPLERQVYSIELNGKGKKKLTPQKGKNNAQFSSTFDYFVNNHSTINSPPSYIVHDRKGKTIRIIEDNKMGEEIKQLYGVSPVEFFNFKTSENVSLNGWMIKPPHFDATKKYPVFMYLYGGPGSQQVTDSWKGQNYWWLQMLAQQGYVVACVDNRGTGGRGEEFKKQTYLNLGKLETQDQIEAAKYLGSLSYTDPERIGIFGWSYGGYMSSLCLLKGNDVFKAAIAVAPVTSWKWYDTIYTERYMRTLKENPEGYAENSPVNFADQLKGNYLLVHGDADDNVHFQQTAEMAKELIKANKQYDTYFYPNRNHGIYGDNARIHLYTKMTNFLNEQLKGNGGGYNNKKPAKP